MRLRLRVLTWRVHGSYLWALAHIGHEILVPVRAGPGGHRPGARWPGNVVEVPVDRVAGTDVDAVLYQSRQNWEVDRHEVLSPAQRAGPAAYVEHDPPHASPTDARHWVDDPATLVVHVSHYNRLMWDCGEVPTTVVEHGVPEPPPGVRWTGEIERALVLVDGPDPPGRRAGGDLVERLQRTVPLDVVETGEVPPADLAAFAARYRVLVHPLRYASLGPAVCQALVLGLPVVGLATTDLPTVIEHGRTGFVTADADALAGFTRALLDDREHAARLGGAARAVARRRFSLARFRADWDRVLRALAPRPPPVAAGAVGAVGAVGLPSR